MKDSKGNLFSKFGQINDRFIVSNEEEVKIGSKVKFRATIKQHREFNDEKINVISTLSKF